MSSAGPPSSVAKKSSEKALPSVPGLEQIHKDYDVSFPIPANAEEDDDEQIDNAEDAVSEQIDHLLEDHPTEAEVFRSKCDSLSLLKQTADGLLDTYVYGDTKYLAEKTMTLSFIGNDTGSSSSERVIHRIDFPSATHTFTKTTRMIKVSYNEEPDFDVEMKPEFQALLDAAEVSPYGHQKETVVNPNVRKAKHIPADRIAEIRGFKVEDIVDEVKTILFPQESKVVAKVSD